MSFQFGEELLASSLGLPVALLKKTRGRELAAGKDWELNKNRVAYSARGLALMAGVLCPKKPAADELAALEKKCALDVAPVAGGLVATVRRFFPNPHLVEVAFPDQTLARIRVRTKAALRVGVTLKVTALGDGRYELAQRLPRSFHEARRNTILQNQPI